MNKIKMSSYSQLSNNNYGKAMIEMVIILPVLLLVAGASLEFARSLRSSQIADTLSRETASIVFRDCLDFEGDQLNACVNQAINDVSAFGNALVFQGEGGIEVIVSVFRFNNANNSFTETILPNATNSRFRRLGPSLTRINSTVPLVNIQQQTQIVAAEVRVPFTSMLSIFPGLPGGAFRYEPGEFYSSSIF